MKILSLLAMVALLVGCAPQKKTGPVTAKRTTSLPVAQVPQAPKPKPTPDYSIPPATPIDVQADTVTPGIIRVSWTANSDNATAYYVERSDDNQNWSLIATVEAPRTSYLDKTVVPSVVYSYRIIAHN